MESEQQQQEQDSIKQLVRGKDLLLARTFASALDSSDLEKVGKPLITLLDSYGLAIPFLEFFIQEEISSEERPTTLFRINSVATKLLVAHAKYAGSSYLKEILAPCVEAMDEWNLTDDAEDVVSTREINPDKVPDLSQEQILENVQYLDDMSQAVFERVVASVRSIPKSLLKIWTCLRQKASDKFGDDHWRSAVAGSVFLRYVCPALVAPEGFKIVANPISPQHRRTCVLVAKAIQSLANGVQFGGKEEYMAGLNNFILRNSTVVSEFFDQLTSFQSHSDDDFRTSTEPLNPSQHELLHTSLTRCHAKIMATLRPEHPHIASQFHASVYPLITLRVTFEGFEQFGIVNGEIRLCEVESSAPIRSAIVSILGTVDGVKTEKVDDYSLQNSEDSCEFDPSKCVCEYYLHDNDAVVILASMDDGQVTEELDKLIEFRKLICPDMHVASVLLSYGGTISRSAAVPLTVLFNSHAKTGAFPLIKVAVQNAIQEDCFEMLFEENSIPSQMLRKHSNMIASEYFAQTFSPCYDLITLDNEPQVNGAIVLERIFQTVDSIPEPLRASLRFLRQIVVKKFGDSVAFSLLTHHLFAFLFAPLFDGDVEPQRSVCLLLKSLSGVFDTDYMPISNVDWIASIVKEYSTKLKIFLDKLTTDWVSKGNEVEEYDGIISSDSRAVLYALWSLRGTLSSLLQSEDQSKNNVVDELSAFQIVQLNAAMYPNIVLSITLCKTLKSKASQSEVVITVPSTTHVSDVISQTLVATNLTSDPTKLKLMYGEASLVSSRTISCCGLPPMKASLTLDRRPPMPFSEKEAIRMIRHVRKFKQNSLVLKDLNLASLPCTEILKLESLSVQSVDLSGNSLTSIPTEIGALSSATSLNLNKNRLSELPPDIASFTRLKQLQLGKNMFKSVPSVVSRLTRLEVLNLRGNQLKNLPPFLTDLVKLKQIHVEGNPLNDGLLNAAQQGVSVLLHEMPPDLHNEFVKSPDIVPEPPSPIPKTPPKTVSYNRESEVRSLLSPATTPSFTRLLEKLHTLNRSWVEEGGWDPSLGLHESFLGRSPVDVMLSGILTMIEGVEEEMARSQVQHMVSYTSRLQVEVLEKTIIIVSDESRKSNQCEIALHPRRDAFLALVLPPQILSTLRAIFSKLDSEFIEILRASLESLLDDDPSKIIRIVDLLSKLEFSGLVDAIAKLSSQCLGKTVSTAHLLTKLPATPPPPPPDPPFDITDHLDKKALQQYNTLSGFIKNHDSQHHSKVMEDITEGGRRIYEQTASDDNERRNKVARYVSLLASLKDPQKLLTVIVKLSKSTKESTRTNIKSH